MKRRSIIDPRLAKAIDRWWDESFDEADLAGSLVRTLAMHGFAILNERAARRRTIERNSRPADILNALIAQRRGFEVDDPE
jgi:hypothetical protein